MSRVRSPNYPALSLPGALERVKQIHRAEGRNAASREAIVKAIGFSTLNGASATTLSALGKFGLLESTGNGEARISELAMRILHPEDDAEKSVAISEAAFNPALFADIREKWPDRPPSDDTLRSFLVRRGFSSGALDQVIQIYRETLDMVEPSVSGHSFPASLSSRESKMASLEATQLQPLPPATAASIALGGRPFAISFDGSVLTGAIAIRTVKDIDRLMRVLAAQKAAIEAMSEEDEIDVVIPSEMEEEASGP